MTIVIAHRRLSDWTSTKVNVLNHIITVYFQVSHKTYIDTMMIYSPESPMSSDITRHKS